MNRKKRMSRKKLTIVSLVAIPAVAGLGFAVTGPAFAGTNGQQIQLCQNLLGYRNVFIQGPDQNGNKHELRIEGMQPNIGCTTVENFWWKGNITIDWSNPDTEGAKETDTTSCSVREVSTRDTAPCFAPL